MSALRLSHWVQISWTYTFRFCKCKINEIFFKQFSDLIKRRAEHHKTGQVHTWGKSRDTTLQQHYSVWHLKVLFLPHALTVENYFSKYTNRYKTITCLMLKKSFNSHCHDWPMVWTGHCGIHGCNSLRYSPGWSSRCPAGKSLVLQVLAIASSSSSSCSSSALSGLWSPLLWVS